MYIHKIFIFIIICQKLFTNFKKPSYAASLCHICRILQWLWHHKQTYVDTRSGRMEACRGEWREQVKEHWMAEKQRREDSVLRTHMWMRNTRYMRAKVMRKHTSVYVCVCAHDGIKSNVYFCMLPYVCICILILDRTIQYRYSGRHNF